MGNETDKHTAGNCGPDLRGRWRGTHLRHQPYLRPTDNEGCAPEQWLAPALLARLDRHFRFDCRQSGHAHYCYGPELLHTKP